MEYDVGCGRFRVKLTDWPSSTKGAVLNDFPGTQKVRSLCILVVLRGPCSRRMPPTHVQCPSHYWVIFLDRKYTSRQTILNWLAHELTPATDGLQRTSSQPDQLYGGILPQRVTKETILHQRTKHGLNRCEHGPFLTCACCCSITCTLKCVVRVIDVVQTCVDGWCHSATVARGWGWQEEIRRHGLLFSGRTAHQSADMMPCD